MSAKFRKIAMWFSITVVLAAAAFGAVQELPEGEGKFLVENNCMSCHTLERFQGKNYGEQYWHDVIAEMREKGSPLSEDDIPTLVAYLVKAFGAGLDPKEEEARQLIQTHCTTCHGMDLIEAKRADKSGWEGIVKGMVASGAQLTEAQTVKVAEYLAKAYPAP